jgi:hypothetical protein
MFSEIDREITDPMAGDEAAPSHVSHKRALRERRTVNRLIHPSWLALSDRQPDYRAREKRVPTEG